MRKAPEKKLVLPKEKIMFLNAEDGGRSTQNSNRKTTQENILDEKMPVEQETKENKEWFKNIQV